MSQQRIVLEKASNEFKRQVKVQVKKISVGQEIHKTVEKILRNSSQKEKKISERR